MKKISFAVSLVLALQSLPTCAKDDYLVYNLQNEPVFQLRFFDKDEGINPAEKSTWSLNQQQKEKIAEGTRYWANIIKPRSKVPAEVDVLTYDDKNAASTALWGVSSVEKEAFPQLQWALMAKEAGGLSGSPLPDALFKIGKLDFDTNPSLLSQLPDNGGKFDIKATVAHEIAHSLGFSSGVQDGSGNKYTPQFFEYNTMFMEHLRDDNGNRARPGQIVLCKGCRNPYDRKGFDLRQDNGYFTGSQVNQVLMGSMPGIPIKILRENGLVDEDYFSHFELKNGLMSHQNYRNYARLMEVELAALQDMRYDIDRRNFYGFSVYGNGLSLVNRHGYFQRNAAGTDYLLGEYNTVPLGVGLHVYGSQNAIAQKADLLTVGTGAAGVRIDGQGNTLTIEQGTRVYANGFNGRGVMFTYGKDHTFVQRGDVQALGEKGIAADFDFGDNVLGNSSEYRGSYLRSVGNKPAALLPELDGALVKDADISGRLVGRRASIYISPNAYVRTINMMNGAYLQGDIFSYYNQRDEKANPRLTQLTFGRLADAGGRATTQADPNFRLRYEGNVEGINNLALTTEGGITALKGQYNIYSVAVKPGSTLLGQGEYRLNTAGDFINNGSVSPGETLGDMTVVGRYEQGERGQLLLKFEGKNRHDTFSVIGQAKLNGQLTFVPQRDWYGTNWRMEVAQPEWVKASTSEGDFSAVNGQLSSPTLTLKVTPKGDAHYELAMRRAPDAYRRYGLGSNASQAGRALDQIVVNARSNMQPLYRALDFSSLDGRDIANTLNQLSPASYSAMVVSSINREHQITDMINGRQPTRATDERWQGFLRPFTGNFRQNSQGDMGYTASDYGMLFGAEKRSEINPYWTVGVHGVIGGQSVRVDSTQNASGSASVFELGVQARYAVDPSAGTYLFGNARTGLEYDSMERSVNVGDYKTHHEGNWTGINSVLTVGGGYRWQLNNNLSIGPLAALDYTLISLPAVTEEGSESGRLKLEGKSFSSLRARVGVGTDWTFPLASGGVLTANLQFSLDPELLNTKLEQRAHFVGYEQAGFQSENTLLGRNALNVRTGVRYSLNNKVELGGSVAGDLFRSGYRSLSGEISATWRF